jgi:hypothetical protein
LTVPWTVAGAGQVMCSSATLIERPTPYLLPTELARGKVNQVRSQLADWLTGGLPTTPQIEQQVHEATFAFSRAVTHSPPEQAGQIAQHALDLAYQAAEQIVQLYVDQVFQVRHQRQAKLDALLGCRLGPGLLSEPSAEALLPACNRICLPFTWNEIEPAEADYRWDQYDELLAWSEGRERTVIAGPLIDFSRGRLPDWLWLWQRDLNSVASFMCDYVETAVKRYHGRIRTWQLSAASNYASLLGLGEEELLWLTVRLVEAARQVDPSLELSIGIAQPWGEYLALQDRNHSPFVFADTLIRSGLNLAALDLEVVMGISPRGSYCRDLLDTSRLLDLYALLGLPLRVTLGYPSAAEVDPLADSEMSISAGYWHEPISPTVQADWASAFGSLLLCKPAVQGITWSHYSDAKPHQFPHCGLLDADGNPKPALARLRELREQHLG